MMVLAGGIVLNELLLMVQGISDYELYAGRLPGMKHFWW